MQYIYIFELTIGESSKRTSTGLRQLLRGLENPGLRQLFGAVAFLTMFFRQASPVQTWQKPEEIRSYSMT